MISDLIFQIFSGVLDSKTEVIFHQLNQTR